MICFFYFALRRLKFCVRLKTKLKLSQNKDFIRIFFIITKQAERQKQGRNNGGDGGDVDDEMAANKTKPKKKQRQ